MSDQPELPSIDDEDDDEELSYRELMDIWGVTDQMIEDDDIPGCR
jgi:hypothetical protein